MVLIECRLDCGGSLHQLVVLAPLAEPGQQHRRRADQRGRIGDVLAGDVGRRAVLGLRHRVLGAGIERGGKPETAGNLARLVGENVAIHIGGDDDVELTGVAHQERRHGVDDALFVFDLRIFRRHRAHAFEIEPVRQAQKKRMSELEAQFLAATRKRAKFAEWRSAIDFPARYTLSQARCADIIVSGGHSDAFSDPFALASPKDLVMQAGRPLLVVPDTVSSLDLRSIVVAWKDTTEARRAVVNSLPLLRKAKDVTVVEIVEAGDSRPAAVSGFAMSWPGCHVMVLPPPNWCRRQASVTPRSSWIEIAADVGAEVSSQAPMATRGSAN